MRATGFAPVVGQEPKVQQNYAATRPTPGNRDGPRMATHTADSTHTDLVAGSSHREAHSVLLSALWYLRSTFKTVSARFERSSEANIVIMLAKASNEDLIPPQSTAATARIIGQAVGR